MTSEALGAYLESRQAPKSLFDFVNSLPAKAQEAVAVLVEELKPSANFLKDILQIADEISSRDKVELVAILTSAALKEHIQHPDRKTRQKQVKTHLEEIRFPQVAAIKKELSQNIEEILQETGVRLALPQDLEGDTLSVSIMLKNTEDCAEAAEALGKLENSPNLKRIFSILRGEA